MFESHKHSPQKSYTGPKHDRILWLRDADGDGKAEKAGRKLVHLDTPGRYSHNGLSGLAFDGNGGLYFGMG